MADNQSIMWPGWETGSCLGKGGFGIVYEIHREDFGFIERKALKIITIPKDKSEVEYMRVEGMNEESITNTFYNKVADIIREYRVMAQLQDNPNIVHCDDFRYVRHEDGLGWDIYIKMELLTPLLKAMDSVKLEADIIRLGIDLCNALQACQEHNLIHRDIKPQNIFLSSKGSFKLGDFGISRTMEHTTMATVGIGTHSFMAPEVARGEKYNHTVDIYSLGLVLYWLLNEYRGPFVPLPPQTPTYEENDKARMRRFSGETIPPPKNGSAELTAVVLKACSFRPEDRYQSANEMLEVLKSLEIPRKQHIINDEETVIDADENKTTSYDNWEARETGSVFSNQETTVNTQNGTDKHLTKDIEKTATDTGKQYKQERHWIWLLLFVMVSFVLLLFAIDTSKYADDASIPTNKHSSDVLFEENILKQPQEYWVQENGEYSYCVNDEKVTGLYTIDGNTYYFDSKGIMQNGLHSIDNEWYLFDSDGKMMTGLVTTTSGDIYYLYDDGHAATGWQEIEGNHYYFNSDGIALTGHCTIFRKDYFFDEFGRMQTGRQIIDAEHNIEAYFGSDGPKEYVIDKTIPLSSSEEYVYFENEKGKMSYSHYKESHKAYENCAYLSGKLKINENTKGNGDGTWQVHVRNLNGVWEHMGYFEVNNGQGAFKFSFDRPVSFDAFVCTMYSAKSWTGNFTQTLEEIWLRCED